MNVIATSQRAFDRWREGQSFPPVARQILTAPEETIIDRLLQGKTETGSTCEGIWASLNGLPSSVKNGLENDPTTTLMELQARIANRYLKDKPMFHVDLAFTRSATEQGPLLAVILHS